MNIPFLVHQVGDYFQDRRGFELAVLQNLLELMKLQQIHLLNATKVLS